MFMVSTELKAVWGNSWRNQGCKVKGWKYFTWSSKHCFEGQSDTSGHSGKTTTEKVDKSDKYWVSPPDPDSNMRLSVYPAKEYMSETERTLNQTRFDTHLWNQRFWKEHNKRFFDEKKRFIEEKRAATGTEKDVTDALSVFYKDFLVSNHALYMSYNREWYQRNFQLLRLSLNFRFREFLRTLTSSWTCEHLVDLQTYFCWIFIDWNLIFCFYYLCSEWNTLALDSVVSWFRNIIYWINIFVYLWIISYF